MNKTAHERLDELLSKGFGPAATSMTLRDYFAAAALAGGLEQGVEHDMADDPNRDNYWHPARKIARRAYALADAMLVERERT